MSDAPKKTCTHCQQDLVIPHCSSPACTWCRACFVLRTEEKSK